MRRKNLSMKLLLLLGVSMTLVACGKPKEPAPTGLPTKEDLEEYIAQQNEEEQQNVEEENNLDNDEQVIEDATVEEDVTEENTDDETNDAETNDDEYQVEGSGYEEIIQLYVDFLSNPDYLTNMENSEKFEDIISIGVEEIAVYAENPFDEVGYVLEDLSGDGKPELIVCMDDDFSSPGEDAPSRILAVYGITPNGARMLLQGWARSRVYITEDNKFYTEGSGGASSSGFYLESINLEGTEIIKEKVIWAESTEDSVSVYDKTDGKNTLISNSWDDYFNLQDECSGSLIHLEFNRFDEID